MAQRSQGQVLDVFLGLRLSVSSFCFLGGHGDKIARGLWYVNIDIVRKYRKPHFVYRRKQAGLSLETGVIQPAVPAAGVCCLWTEYTWQELIRNLAWKEELGGKYQTRSG
jgi:hypothetical protein